LIFQLESHYLIFAVQKKATQQLTIACIIIWTVVLLEIFFGYRLLKREESQRMVVIAELEESIGRVKMLSGLLPIFSVCKKFVMTKDIGIK
jgi:hypothetical protein